MKALLSLVTEAALQGFCPRIRLRNVYAWDLWWVRYRSQTPLSTLGICVDDFDGGCRDCLPYLENCFELSSDLSYPEFLKKSSTCRCLTEWAQGVRRGADGFLFPSADWCFGFVKPMVDVFEAVEAFAHLGCSVVQLGRRRLGIADMRLLYPESFRADYLHEHEEYLASGEVTVIDLAGLGRVGMVQAKTAVRKSMRPASQIRNCIHLADNLGEAICDARHLGPSEYSYSDIAVRLQSGLDERFDQYLSALTMKALCGPDVQVSL